MLTLTLTNECRGEHVVLSQLNNRPDTREVTEPLDLWAAQQVYQNLQTKLGPDYQVWIEPHKEGQVDADA